MVERVRGWKVGDEVFPTRADAERHEAREALLACLKAWISDVRNPADNAQFILTNILEDPLAFRDLIRPLVPLVNRKPKAPNAKAMAKAAGKQKAAAA